MRGVNARVYCSRLNCQNVSGSSSCRHSGPKPNLKDETDHLARWPMSGHGSAGGCLPTTRPGHQRLKQGSCGRRVARTRVNEKDAFGDGSRDRISGGKYTKLWCRAHVKVSVAISNSATVNTTAALRPTRAYLVVTGSHLKYRLPWLAVYILRTTNAMAGK